MMVMEFYIHLRHLTLSSSPFVQTQEDDCRYKRKAVVESGARHEHRHHADAAIAPRGLRAVVRVGEEHEGDHLRTQRQDHRQHAFNVYNKEKWKHRARVDGYESPAALAPWRA